METIRHEMISKFVFKELNSDNSGHDYNHAMRVYKNALSIIHTLPQLSEESKNIILTCSLLHDCVDYKLYKNVGKQNKKITKLLKSLKYSNSDIKVILEIINNLSYSKGISKERIEEQVVSDADRLDAIGAIGIIRAIEFGTKHNRKFYNPENDKDKNVTIMHFYEKLLNLKDVMYTDYAKSVAVARHEYMEQFLYEFYKEIK